MKYSGASIESDDRVTEEKPLSISELTRKIKNALESDFDSVWIQGEISNFKPYPSSGHLYFSLKDEGATLSCAAFGWARRPQSKLLKDGVQVLAHGKVSVYPPRGGYQLLVDHLEPMGSGALQLEFEKRKAKLAAEGLFAPERKKPLPSFPMSVAIVTSPSGAVVQDFIRILERRAPHIRILIVPSLTQGETAATELIAGLRLASKNRLGEIIVLARGGGSMEDLWCFNDEELVREIARCEIPVISAVGHEIDFTLSDFAADVRAPTPSSAAEIVSEDWMGVRERLEDLTRRMLLSLRNRLNHWKERVERLRSLLVSPLDRIRMQSQLLDETYSRLVYSMRTRLSQHRSHMDREGDRLKALSPLSVLERGYAIVRDKSGKQEIHRSKTTGKKGQEIVIRFTDGEREAELH